MAAINGSGKRRRLTVPEKYQVFCDVVSGPGSQREIADKWRVDRSTVVHVCKTARQGALDALALSRPGRPGKTAVELALEDALAGRRPPARGAGGAGDRAAPAYHRKRALGLTGPVPMRVDAGVKAGLLDLVAAAVEAGWSLRRACGLLEVNHPRVLGWLDRLDTGVGLEDRRPGPDQAAHALLDWEREAVIALLRRPAHHRPLVSQAGAPRLPRGARARLGTGACWTPKG